MSRDDVRELLATALERWTADPETDLVWSGEYEGRIGTRMRQRTRDFTTVWFTVGERTVRWEAYLLPAPPEAAERVASWCLRRNWTSWPSAIAADSDGDLYVVGRVPLDVLDERWLDLALGSVHDLVETSFRPLLQLAFLPREKSP